MTEDMDTVECPGCLKMFDPALMNHTRMGITIETPGEGITSSLSYCPTCGPRVRALDQEGLLDNLEMLVRTMLSDEKLREIRSPHGNR